MIRRLFPDTRAAAATEFALSLPMMLALLFVGMEAGHFFWSEHKLVKAVRDGARYAARANIEDVCQFQADGSLVNRTDQRFQTLAANIRALTATGALASTDANGQPAYTGLPPTKVPGWDISSIVVEQHCGEFVDSGIYGQIGTEGPLVTISSGPVAYPAILNGLGVLDTTITIQAEASAAVMGI